MDRCPQCHAELEAGHRFCPDCGRPVGEGDGADHENAAAPDGGPVPRWRRGPRFVLSFLAIVLALALVFVLAVIYFIRHTTIVTTTKNGERIEAPGGVVTTSNNPAVLARSLGLDSYPGAMGLKGTQVAVANGILVSLSFRTHDTPRQVIHFYHIRYPDAMVKEQNGAWTLVQVGLRDTLSIKAAPGTDFTEITVSDIQH